ncbi:MAG TPA: hypothetical protein VL944_00210 [Candidatus Acidoferrum sp.]|nr:hypothetical protein [Candidatus Acidoferrum sp.]
MAMQEVKLVERALVISGPTWNALGAISNTRKVPLEQVLSEALTGNPKEVKRTELPTSNGQRELPIIEITVKLPESRLVELSVAARGEGLELNTYIHEHLEEFCKKSSGDSTPTRRSVSLTLRADVLKGLRRRAEAQNVDVSTIVERILDTDESLQR